jgi:hypothetical protein
MSDTVPQTSDNSDATPEDMDLAAEERKIRVLKRVVVTIAVLIVLTVIAMIGGIIYKANNKAPAPEPIAQTEVSIPAPVIKALPENIELLLPTGAVIENISLNGNQLAVQWWQADANQNHIWIIDLTTSLVSQKIHVKKSK